ncbi:hypothetical protein CLOM_g4269 [Closterium sp. NIES-68]|nr:hypothetical protein CLOM_g4269 [Closterium sp. NIES-68]GJP69704.1 hypothetical protein CLOP_g706 [Closterium sp. NIES-67]
MLYPTPCCLLPHAVSRTFLPITTRPPSISPRVNLVPQVMPHLHVTPRTQAIPPLNPSGKMTSGIRLA